MSVRTSDGLMSMTMVSSTTGVDARPRRSWCGAARIAVDRALIRTSRCTPALCFQPAVGVGALHLQGGRLDARGARPRSPPAPRRSCRGRCAQREYIRMSISAQSADSVPPAPELISTIGVVGVGLAGEQGLQLRAGQRWSLRALQNGLGGLVADSPASSFQLGEFGQLHGVGSGHAPARCTASIWPDASRVRSRITAWASSGLSHRGGVLGPWRSARRGAGARDPSQRRLLSSPTDCSMSAAAASTSALIESAPDRERSDSERTARTQLLASPPRGLCLAQLGGRSDFISTGPARPWAAAWAAQRRPAR